MIFALLILAVAECGRCFHSIGALPLDLKPQSLHDLVGLSAWLKGHGGFLNRNLRLGDDSPNCGSRRGVTFTGDESVSEGTVLASFPSNCFLQLSIREGCDEEEDSLSFAQTIAPEDREDVRLGLLAMHKKRCNNGESPWISDWWSKVNVNLQQPFLYDQMQAAMTNLPFRHKIIRLVHSLNQLHKYRKRAETRTKMLIETPKDLLWAVFTARAKKICFPSGLSTNLDPGAVVVPLLEHVKHSFNPSARLVWKFYPPESHLRVSRIELVAVSAIHVGDNVTFDFGNYGNDAFLFQYGFVVPNNPHDRYNFPFENSNLKKALGKNIPPFDILSPLKKKLLGALGLLRMPTAVVPFNPIVSIGGVDLIDSRLLAAVRILLAPDSKGLVGEHIISQLLDGKSNPSYLDVEVASLRCIKEIVLSELYEGFTTCLDEDIQLTERGSSSISWNMRQIIQYQIEMKRMLLRVADALESRIEKLLLGEQVVHNQSSQPST